jgi:hypothetical protein
VGVSTGRAGAARRVHRLRTGRVQASRRAIAEAPSPAGTAAVVGMPALETARRIGESIAIAAVSSAGLYLVGTVYVDAYYGRLSIDATSLDLAPTYVALQAIHVLPGLLQYPSLLLVVYLLYRTFGGRARRLRTWLEGLRGRHPRAVLILGNLLVIAPLLIGALVISYQEAEVAPRSVLAEIAGLLESAALVLFVYAIWLGWSQRAFIVSEIVARKLLPIALVFTVYLLTALASTASTATLAAELLLVGASDASMEVEFVMREGSGDTLAGKELLLVAVRFGDFYVVERQPFPPSQRPTAYIVPDATVDVATVRRLNDANDSLADFMTEMPE